MISNTLQIYHNNSEKQEKDLNSLARVPKDILLLFIDINKYTQKIYMTRETIAERVGCSPTHVSRCTTLLNNLGYIRKKRWFVGVREKCSYKVMPQYLGIIKKFDPSNLLLHFNISLSLKYLI